MALKIMDEVIQATAIEQVKDTLLQATKETGGVIGVGKNIHKGDFIEDIFFDNFGNIQRRDPNTQTAVTPERLSTLEDSSVKLYFRDDVFVTNTELKRYGTSMKNFNQKIGRQFGVNIARWAIQKGLIALIGAITSQAGLVEGDGTADISIGLLNSGMFKLGDSFEDVKSFVLPSVLTSTLMSNAISASTDQISYGAVYKAQIGTLGRNLWTVDSAALNWSDGTNSGHYAIELTPNAISIDESELVEIITEVDTLKSNAGINFHIEGGYTLNVKGFSYNKAQGANPADSVLADNASWNLVSQLKNSAGVVVKTK